MDGTRTRAYPSSALMKCGKSGGSDLRGQARPWRAPPSPSLDREALEIFFGLGRIEFLAHDLETLRAPLRRGEPRLLHELGGVGGEVDLLSYCLVVHVALDLPPAFHLREDPNRKRLPRERIEIDAIGIALHIAQTVGVGA